jgi:hypothetical protein
VKNEYASEARPVQLARNIHLRVELTSYPFCRGYGWSSTTGRRHPKPGKPPLGDFSLSLERKNSLRQCSKLKTKVS